MHQEDLNLKDKRQLIDAKPMFLKKLSQMVSNSKYEQVWNKWKKKV